MAFSMPPSVLRTSYKFWGRLRQGKKDEIIDSLDLLTERVPTKEDDFCNSVGPGHIVPLNQRIVPKGLWK